MCIAWARGLTKPISHTFSKPLSISRKDVDIIIDPHNYMDYGNLVIGNYADPAAPTAVDFATFWKVLERMATNFAGNDHIIYGLMNESITKLSLMSLGRQVYRTDLGAWKWMNWSVNLSGKRWDDYTP